MLTQDVTLSSPRQPPKPAYVDPADRVASNKAQADDIKTWAVSELDKKGKKKKGTLGVGNGAIFFASESDKVNYPFKKRPLFKGIMLIYFTFRPLSRNGKPQMFSPVRSTSLNTSSSKSVVHLQPVYTSMLAPRILPKRS